VGNQRGKVFNIDEPGDYLVGRGVNADIELLDIAASRNHAEISFKTDTDFYVHNLRNTNGTTVNGKPVSKTKLHDGDRLKIGESEILVSLGTENIAHDTQKAPVTGTDTDMTEFMDSLMFCEKCNESVPMTDITQGRAAEIDGKVYCQHCLKDMGNGT